MAHAISPRSLRSQKPHLSIARTSRSTTSGTAAAAAPLASVPPPPPPLHTGRPPPDECRAAATNQSLSGRPAERPDSKHNVREGRGTKTSSRRSKASPVQRHCRAPQECSPTTPKTVRCTSASMLGPLHSTCHFEQRPTAAGSGWHGPCRKSSTRAHPWPNKAGTAAEEDEAHAEEAWPSAAMQAPSEVPAKPFARRAASSAAFVSASLESRSSCFGLRLLRLLQTSPASAGDWIAGSCTKSLRSKTWQTAPSTKKVFSPPPSRLPTSLLAP
mmetsp:Transcript_7943/g.20235  ORF Transcript_7943/g.20235 Transcript_7943/m.20235 type:complete len:272 (-) Transcript_7943:319-1134(-)